MSWTCPLCGYENDEATIRCMCGFQADETVLKQSREPEADIFGGTEKSEEIQLSRLDIDITSSQQKEKNKKGKETHEKNNESEDEIFIKDIDSWKISFSGQDQCLYFSTPALKSFRLRLTPDDLKELIDFISEKTNIDMKLIKKNLEGNEIVEIVDMLENMIEAKKEKIKIKFSNEELQVIADIINKKIQ